MGRRLLKTLRKHQPRDDAATATVPPMCRRARRHENRSETCHSSLPGGHYTPIIADHVADAIRHAQNSEKFASVGIDMISNFANHFAALLYPETQATNQQAGATASSSGANAQPSTSQVPTQAETAPIYPEVPAVSTQSDSVAMATTPAPAVVDRDLVLIEDDVDDDDYVQVPINGAAAATPMLVDQDSSNSSVDSVEKALMDAAKAGHLQKQ